MHALFYDIQAPYIYIVPSITHLMLFKHAFEIDQLSGKLKIDDGNVEESC